MTYWKLFEDLHTDLIPYYRSWAHDVPMVLSSKKDGEIGEIARILYKCCLHYIRHYREFLDLIPYDDEILSILEFSEQYPYRAGTWRPDYVIREDGRILLCEITSRFFGNGYFLSYFMEHAGLVFAEEAGIRDRKSYFEDMLSYFADMRGEKKRLLVVKSADKSDSIRLYVPFYKALGMETVILEADQIESNLDLVKGSMVVSALNQKDMLGLETDTLKTLVDAGMRNDMRTIFLLHDKRFFRLFHEKRFTDGCLTEEETAFLKKHTIETYIPGDGEIWDIARREKDGFILKHHCLGKSEKVYAGCVTEKEEWERLYREGEVKNMILQPFIRQKLYPTVWKDVRLDDYVSGTILTVDDRYFGTGLFRTSTRPVINQTDAHKIAPLITDEAERIPGCHIL